MVADAATRDDMLQTECLISPGGNLSVEGLMRL